MASIKSRPIYGKLRIDPRGATHLIVTDLPALPANVIEDAENIETWIGAADVLTALAQRLSREHAGFRLYAVGAEPFLWDVMNITRAAGLGDGEVFLTHAGSQRRRVYCTHCKTIIDDVTTNIVPCPGCGAHLFVRDHFSRRLAAFMGVKADAEVPGDIPAIEVLYP